MKMVSFNEWFLSRKLEKSVPMMPNAKKPVPDDSLMLSDSKGKVLLSLTETNEYVTYQLDGMMFKGKIKEAIGSEGLISFTKGSDGDWYLTRKKT